MENSEILILVLNSKIFTGGYSLKIYKCNNYCALVELRGIYHYYNSNRRFKDDYRDDCFIFESDVDVGKKTRIIIYRSNPSKEWIYSSYINKTKFKYSDEDEWSLKAKGSMY
jgi:hypothetical protein